MHAKKSRTKFDGMLLQPEYFLSNPSSETASFPDGGESSGTDIYIRPA
jgi:hypothetical protein